MGCLATLKPATIPAQEGAYVSIEIWSQQAYFKSVRRFGPGKIEIFKNDDPKVTWIKVTSE